MAIKGIHHKQRPFCFDRNGFVVNLVRQNHVVLLRVRHGNMYFVVIERDGADIGAFHFCQCQHIPKQGAREFNAVGIPRRFGYDRLLGQGFQCRQAQGLLLIFPRDSEYGFICIAFLRMRKRRKKQCDEGQHGPYETMVYFFVHLHHITFRQIVYYNQFLH